MAATVDRPLDELIRYEVADGIARLTIDRTEAGNSLTGGMRDRLSALFDAASDDLAVRAVILSAAGDRHFCTGAGLGGPPSPAPPSRPPDAPERAVGDVARTIRRGWQRLVTSILDCEKPVIAAVNGTAAGGGAHLVLACDLIVMADTARLIEVFVRRGIVPDAGGCYLLPRILGPHRTKQLMFFGDELTATDCERWGVANLVVPAAELRGAVDRWANRLAGAPTKALTMTKWLVNRSFESSRQTAFEEEAYAQDLVSTTTDSQLGLAAFVERTTPAFRGW